MRNQDESPYAALAAARHAIATHERADAAAMAAAIETARADAAVPRQRGATALRDAAEAAVRDGWQPSEAVAEARRALADAAAAWAATGRRNPTTADLPLRHSHLRQLGTRSPAHCLHARAGGEDDPTYAMERGSGLHGLLLGPPGAVAGWDDGRPRQGKDFDAFRAEHPDALILTASGFRALAPMVEAVQAHPVAGPLCSRAGFPIIERTILWTQRGGLVCRATPDVIRVGQGARIDIVDVKTTADATPQHFAWHARRMGYDTQLAWYRRAVCAAHAVADAPPPDVTAWLVVIEAKAPHIVTVWRLTDAALDAADRRLDEWLGVYVGCEQSGDWPDYGEQVLDVDERDIEIEDMEVGNE